MTVTDTVVVEVWCLQMSVLTQHGIVGNDCYFTEKYRDMSTLMLFGLFWILGTDIIFWYFSTTSDVPVL